MEGKRLLLIGSGSGRYRSHIMEAAAAIGVRITLLTDKEVAWEEKLCERILFVDIKDAGAMRTFPAILQPELEREILNTAEKGIKPSLNRIRNGGAAIRFLIPQKSGKLVEYPDLSSVINYPGVHELSFKGKLGLLKLPPEGFFTRFGFIITKADEPVLAYRKALEAERLLKLNIV